MMELALWS